MITILKLCVLCVTSFTLWNSAQCFLKTAEAVFFFLKVEIGEFVIFTEIFGDNKP